VLAAQVSPTECPVVATPAPVNPTLIGEPVALLEILTLPLTDSACLGANVTLSVADWPGASVAPLIPPPATTSVAVTLTPETVMLELPVFFRLTERVFALPTGSFPKLRLVGVATSVREAAMPVPFIANVRVPSVALLVIFVLAETVPITVGVKTSVQFVVAPVAKTAGIVIPLRTKAELVDDSAEIITLAVPVFFSWTVCDTLDPNGTLPKPTLLGVAEIVPPDDATPVPVI